MAFHIFNTSVDRSDNVPKGLANNDMESIVEIILEQVLNIDYAIAEKGKCTTDGGFGFAIEDNMELFMPHQTLTIIYPIYPVRIDNSFAYQEQYSEQFHPEIVPPPPKG